MGANIDRLEIEIEAAAAKANKQLDGLVSRLEKISGSLSKINSGISGTGSKMGQTAKSANSAVSSVNNFSKSIVKANKSFAQMAGRFYANYYLIIRGIKKIGKAIGSSMDYVETYNYFSVTMDKIGREFGSMYEQYGYSSAEAYMDSFSSRMNELTKKMTGYNVGSNGELTLTDKVGLGLDPETIMNYQASIAAITNSVGLVGENSINATKALTMLSADMSSLKNVDLSTAMTNFQSGLIGQSRALYKYGIDITNATLQTYAYDLGLNKSVSEMTQAEKMQLRLIAILDQSKVAWGDQANTINSVANQYRILKQQVSNFARVIGNLFLPIVQKVLPVVNGLLIALQRLFSVLGFKLWGGDWLKNTMDGISGVGSSVFDSVEESTDSTANNLEDANKAAEKLRKTVLGIDELNINSPDTNSGSASSDVSVGGIDLSGAIGDALAEYESIWNEAFKNAENKAQEFANKFYKMLQPVEKLFTDIFAGKWFEAGKDVSNIVSGIYNFFANAISKVDWYQIGYNIGMFLEGINWTRILGSIGKFVWEALTAAIDLWKGAFDAAPIETAIITAVSLLKFTPLGGILIWKIKESLMNSFNGLTSLLTGGGLIQLSASIPLAGTPAFDVIGSNIVDGISECLKELLPNGIFDLLSYSGSGAVVGVLAGSWLPGLGQLAGAIIGALVGALISQWPLITEWWNTTVVTWWNETIVAFWNESIAPWFTVEKWAELLNGMVEGFIVKWEELKVWWGKTAIVKWWNEDVSPWFKKEKWMTLIDTIKVSFKTKWDETVGQWKTDISTWWAQSVAPWFTKEKWINILQNVPTAFKEAFKCAANAAIEIFNKLISWINDKMSFSWDAVPVLGIEAGSIQLITIPMIPRFEEGGFPETGQLFLARENGINEMVGSIGNRSAVANNDQIVESVTYGVRQGVMEAVSEILAPYLAEISQNTRDTADKDFSVNIGDREIAKANERGKAEIGYALIT